MPLQSELHFRDLASHPQTELKSREAVPTSFLVPKEKEAHMNYNLTGRLLDKRKVEWEKNPKRMREIIVSSPNRHLGLVANSVSKVRFEDFFMLSRERRR